PVAPAAGARGALHVLDALVRWYAKPPADDAGLSVALDHARRLLRPGSRLLVLADAASIATVPASRWPALSMHNEVVVLLIDDPLERDPPHAWLPFAGGAQRIELDLASDRQRRRWQQAFPDAARELVGMLRARGIRADMLSTDAPSQSWLPLFGATGAA
ncbi:MAG: DUF58 domain-containing protein, partial [Luteimonas sp.]|nr:DUF58 domain-containing protein [Luteimonas sp.]